MTMTRKEVQKRYREKNKDKIRIGNYAWRDKRSEYWREYKKKWRMRPANQVKEKKRREEYKKRNPNWYKDRYRKNKLLCIEYYSKGTMGCACCGEKTYEFLAMDHIHGGGGKHRKEIKTTMVSWLIKNNFPGGFRILCHNCNMAMSKGKQCPHVAKRVEDIALGGNTPF